MDNQNELPTAYHEGAVSAVPAESNQERQSPMMNAIISLAANKDVDVDKLDRL